MKLANTVRMFTVAVAAGLVSLTALGCEKSSRMSSSSYEYSNEPTGRPASSRPEQEVREQPTGSDYEMVSPGEMVVEPKRNNP